MRELRETYCCTACYVAMSGFLIRPPIMEQCIRVKARRVWPLRNAVFPEISSVHRSRPARCGRQGLRRIPRNGRDSNRCVPYLETIFSASPQLFHSGLLPWQGPHIRSHFMLEVIEKGPCSESHRAISVSSTEPFTQTGAGMSIS